MNIPYLRYGLWSALILFFTWATLGSACAQARYTITDLGTPDGSYAPNAAGINNRGQVIGGSYKHIVDYGDVDVPWLWDSVKGLQAFPFYGRPFGINDAGTITGWTRNSAGAYSGFLYNGTSQQTIPLLAGATDTLPRSIDADGTVVGYAAGAAGTTAFTFDQVHGTTPIGSLVPGGESQATGIRNGKIAGWAASSQLDMGGHPAFHAFLYDGTMHDLGTLGGLNSIAYGINASGQVVGGADTATNDFSGQVVSHAFVYSMGKMHDLGTTDPMFAPSSYGTSINAVGQVVGVAYSPSGFGGNAFLWTPEVSNSTQGKMELLQDLLPADAGWRLYSAWGINNAGQITGTGFHNGVQAAFLMTPVDRIDSDGDGIPDQWERDKGYWYEGANGRVWVDLPEADQSKRDVYVQIDWLEADDHTHDPWADDSGPQKDAGRQRMNDVVTAFKNAGITLHLIRGNPIRETASNLAIGSSDGTYYSFEQYNDLVSKPDALREAKSLAYRFCLFAHSFPSTISRDTLGIAQDTPSQDFIIAVAGQDLYYGKPVGSPLIRAATFMHELGHTLGLRHGGADNLAFKPNYLSVMSYLYTNTGVARNGVQGILDYSHVELPVLDENHLDESVGFNGGQASQGFGITWLLSGQLQRKWFPSASIDWNLDGSYNKNLSLDISSYSPDKQSDYGQKTKLYGHDDWSNLVFRGGNIGARAYAINPVIDRAVEPSPLPSSVFRPLPVLGVALRSAPGAVRVSWTPAGRATEFIYRIYRSVASGPYVLLHTGTDPLVADIGLDRGKRYSYYVTVIDGSGNESEPSGIVSCISL